MKRIFFILLFSSLMCVGAFADVFSIGLKVGYSTVLEKNQYFNNLFDVKTNLQNGFNTGIFVRFGRRVFAQPEVNYNFLSYVKTIEYEGGEVKTLGYQNNTVDVPVLLGVSAVNLEKFKLRIMVGPKFSFNVGSTNNESFENESIRTTRLGLDCGLGFDFWKITLDARYTLLPDLYKYKDNSGNTISHTPMNSFVVTIGVRIFGNNM